MARTIAREVALVVVCFAAAYPIAGFVYGLRDSDAGWALDMNLADGIAAGVVMAIEAVVSFGFVSLGSIEDIGEIGEVVNLYPLILRCALVVYIVARLSLLAIRLARRRGRRA